jgi:hypothetical protein
LELVKLIVLGLDVLGELFVFRGVGCVSENGCRSKKRDGKERVFMPTTCES